MHRALSSQKRRFPARAALFMRMTLKAGLHAVRLSVMVGGAALYAIKDLDAIESFATEGGVQIPGVELDSEMAAPDSGEDGDDSDGEGAQSGGDEHLRTPKINPSEMPQTSTPTQSAIALTPPATPTPPTTPMPLATPTPPTPPTPPTTPGVLVPRVPRVRSARVRQGA